MAFDLDKFIYCGFYNEEKGYGFITDLGNNDSHFVHINNIAEPIRENDKVIAASDSNQSHSF